MKAQDFRGFLEQLGDLTEVQRSALASALAGKGSGNEAIALIEIQFSAAPACGHCKSESFGSWGHASGLRRYRCHDCHRTFNAPTGTPLAQLYRRDAWLEYARALVDRVSLRKVAKRAGIGLEASFRWRHRFFVVSGDFRVAAAILDRLVPLLRVELGVEVDRLALARVLQGRHTAVTPADRPGIGVHLGLPRRILSN